jgi:ribosome-binding protein aMBF1 (putative translation factor)
MIMNWTNKKEIRRAFTEIVEPADEANALAMETRLLMYRFLSEVEKISKERGISRKELAQMIGTSPSFITQLFQGTKTVNLTTLAKFQKALNFTFRIEAIESKAINNVKNIPKKDIDKYRLAAG